ncbi:hypothetical protein CVT26_003932 [Gymnopilus dilepis]|uniref:F-box domain-containing protein n=1 Tax=Gymnopilus dilepis TaxID=231916 RepID=A0A409X7H7_9AGAR|nr:hypothetical protein CVT26_003932 [Gymnopilus dilepis]
MAELSVEIIDMVLDELEAAGARQALKAVGRASKHYRLRVFHRLYKIILLSGEPKILAFLAFVKLGLLKPLYLPRICIELSTTPSESLAATMNNLLNSVSLTYLELREQAQHPCTSELTSLALRIVASAKQPLTIVLVGLRNATWRFSLFASHLELRGCSLALDYPPLGDGFNLPLQSLSFSTDGGIESLDIFNTLRMDLLQLTHLLLSFKPHGQDFEVDDAFVAALSTAGNLEDITVVYEPNALDSSTLAAAVESLVKALSSVARLRKYAINLHWRFTCSPSHVSIVIACMPRLEYFNLISISILGSEEASREILKQGYNLLVMPWPLKQGRPNRNKQFRVDRICISRSQQRTIIDGVTVQDSMTRDVISRRRIHDKLCPWFIRHDTGNFEVTWMDSMVRAEEL